MEIKKERQRVTEVSYLRVFKSLDDHRNYFKFPCDEHGEVDKEKLYENSRENFEMCLNRKYDLYDAGVEKVVRSWMEPAIGICEVCGEEVKLVDRYYAACQCKCGQWYNIGGQALLPPDQWEETLEPED